MATSLLMKKEIEDLKKHVPNTGIIDKIKEATKEGRILEKVKITQKEARDLFTLNDDNRPVHFDRVHRYISIMNDDKWEFNGDPLCVTKDMRLINGQKRLIAIIWTGKAQVFNIQCGLPQSAFATIDAGQPRSASDVIALMGFENQVIVAAIIRAEIYFREQSSVASKVTRKSVSVQDVEKWTETNDTKRLVYCAEKGIEMHAYSKFLSQSSWGTLLFILTGIHKAQGDRFVNLLATGENISRGSAESAIWHLRKRLVDLEKLQFQKHPLDLKFRYIMRAWNLWRKGELIDKLTIVQKSKWEPIEKPL